MGQKWEIVSYIICDASQRGLGCQKLSVLFRNLIQNLDFVPYCRHQLKWVFIHSSGWVGRPTFPAISLKLALIPSYTKRTLLVDSCCDFKKHCLQDVTLEQWWECKYPEFCAGVVGGNQFSTSLVRNYHCYVIFFRRLSLVLDLFIFIYLK